MIALGLDVGLLLRSLHGSLDYVGRDRQIAPSLGVERAAGRSEVVVPRGQGDKIDITAGVVFESLPAGQAQGLTTGFTTFAPGAQLAYHRHPYA